MESSQMEVIVVEFREFSAEDCYGYRLPLYERIKRYDTIR